MSTTPTPSQKARAERPDDAVFQAFHFGEFDHFADEFLTQSVGGVGFAGEEELDWAFGMSEEGLQAFGLGDEEVGGLISAARPPEGADAPPRGAAIREAMSVGGRFISVGAGRTASACSRRRCPRSDEGNWPATGAF